jgi:alkylation response protein AidB-like acyl-CoA dehydrogenase
MDFNFSEEQRMMAGALRALLDDICAGSSLRAVFERRDAAQEERWRRLSEMGLCGVLAPAASGGLGLADADFVLLAEETGRAALPEPLSEQAGVAVPLLAELASDARAARLLASAASGAARIAVAHPQNPYINVPPGVTHYLLCTPGAITLLDAAQARTVPEVSIDAARQLVRMEAVEGEALLIGSGTAARSCVARAANRGAVYTAAQCLGLAERMITLAVEYAKQRVQFGKPIGSYQAIKHHLASAQVKLEFARPVVYAAVTRVADTDVRALAAASHAKLAAADAAELAARTAIQVHGAMGYSWEVDLQFYMKRAWALAGAWGDRSFHARRVQSLICGGELALGPDATFERRG